MAQLESKHQLFRHKLFRRSMVQEGGRRFKDLSRLNRDLSKVIVIDSKPENLVKHPENGIWTPPWTGDKDDTVLVDLVPLLHVS